MQNPMSGKVLQPLLWALLGVILFPGQHALARGGQVTIFDNNGTLDNPMAIGHGDRMRRSPMPLSSMTRWTDDEVEDELEMRLSVQAAVANHSRLEMRKISENAEDQQQKLDSSSKRSEEVQQRRKRRSGVEGATNRRPDINKRGKWWIPHLYRFNSKIIPWNAKRENITSDSKDNVFKNIILQSQ